MKTKQVTLLLSKSPETGLWELKRDGRRKIIAAFAKRQDALVPAVLVGRKGRWGTLELQHKDGTWSRRKFGRWPAKKTEGWVND